MKRKEFKNLINVWNNYLNEAGSVLTSSEIESMGSNYQNSTSINSAMELISDEKLIKKDIMIHAGPATFISFINPWDETTPTLSVNPNIEFDTPHGIYGYPLTRKNAQNLIRSGKPTKADFASDFKYFHIFKKRDLDIKNSLEDPEGEIQGSDKSHIIFRKDGSNNYPRKDFKKDFKEIVRIFLFILINKFDSEKYKISSQQANLNPDSPDDGTIVTGDSGQTQHNSYIAALELYNIMVSNDSFDKEKFYNKLISTQAGKMFNAFGNTISFSYKYYSTLVSYIIIMSNHNQTKLNKELRDFLNTDKYRNLVSEIHDSIKDRVFKDRKTKFHVIWLLCLCLSRVMESFNFGKSKQSGYYFSLLLNIIGVNNITDMGSGSVHDNEPEQSLNISFESQNDNSIEHIGTYLNIFADLYNPENIMKDLANLFKD